MDLKRFFNLFGLAARQDDTEETLSARADVLGALFPEDDAFVRAQLEAGNDPIAAVAALRTAHAEEIQTLTDENASLAERVETLEADAETAQANLATVTKERDTARKQVADYEARPPVTQLAPEVGQQSTPSTEDRKAELIAEYEGDSNLQRQFRSGKAYAAYTMSPASQ